VRASKAPKPGSRLRLADAFEAEVLGRGGDAGSADAALYRLRFPSEPHALLERHGHVPLPPYIAHADDGEDAERYQTVFAARPGAVAAPTAALHVDAGVLERLRQRGIGLASLTLHVGAGTFQPVRTENLDAHRMHREWFEIPPSTVDAIARTRAGGGRVVAIGTTTLRALEAAATGREGLRAGADETAIFIRPGFPFRVIDLLVTNFHLPKSTLMMLVSAFAGHARVMALYRHAIAARYRFFSYGDAMLLRRMPTAAGRRHRLNESGPAESPASMRRGRRFARRQHVHVTTAPSRSGRPRCRCRTRPSTARPHRGATSTRSGRRRRRPDPRRGLPSSRAVPLRSAR
jgi:S-adenosylmethionine:tRNA ribosyltransferase-isomerase